MSESENHVVQIPSKAVADKADVRQPVRDLLEGLYLIGSPEDTEKAGDFSAAFKGPPQSVALIEAGATTATKLWAGGLSAAVAAGWVTVGAWWGDQAVAVQATVIGGAAFATAAVALAIGYLFGSDVRGRAASAVATINARAQVAVEMIQAAQGGPRKARRPGRCSIRAAPRRNSGDQHCRAGRQRGELACRRDRATRRRQIQVPRRQGKGQEDRGRRHPRVRVVAPGGLEWQLRRGVKARQLARQELAAGVGFEPTAPREGRSGFQDRPVRPLRHPA
jgi:hypothetical protein